MGGYELMQLIEQTKQEFRNKAEAALLYGSPMPAAYTSLGQNAINEVMQLQTKISKYRWNMELCENDGPDTCKVKNKNPATNSVLKKVVNARSCDLLPSTDPDATELASIRFSASGQFSEYQFSHLVSFLTTTDGTHTTVSPSKIYIVDLRKEVRGFINGKPITLREGKINTISYYDTTGNEYATAISGLKTIAPTTGIDIYTKPLKGAQQANAHYVAQFKTEEDIVTGYTKPGESAPAGIHSINIRIQDHTRPSDETVDQFVSFVTSLSFSGSSDDPWVHFHCSGGHGRATTGSIMYYIMRKTLADLRTMTINDIFKKVAKLGGKDFTQPYDFNAEVRDNDLCLASWESSHHNAKLKFMDYFLAYVIATDHGKKDVAGPNSHIWSVWCQSDPTENKCNGFYTPDVIPALKTIGECYVGSGINVDFLFTDNAQLPILSEAETD